jgi:hypothetical protein
MQPVRAKDQKVKPDLADQISTDQAGANACIISPAMSLEKLLAALDPLTDKQENLWIERQVLRSLACVSFSEEEVAQVLSVAMAPDSELHQQAEKIFADARKNLAELVKLAWVEICAGEPLPYAETDRRPADALLSSEQPNQSCENDAAEYAREVSPESAASLTLL